MVYRQCDAGTWGRMICPVFLRSFSLNEVGISHQGFIYCLGRFPSFVDRPDNKGLSPVHITCREDILYGSLIFLCFRCHVRTRCQIYFKGIGHIFLLAKKTGCDQYDIHFNRPFASFHRNHHHATCFLIFFAL